MRAWRAITLAAALIAGPAIAADAPPKLASDAELRARYRLPTSHFVDIDGTPIHYSDEGKGPAIVLIHGSYGSLLQWNEWAKALKSHYRIIRFDLPPAGLAGPAPDGDYSTEKRVLLIDALTKMLNVKRFLLVGTSSGAIAAAAFAAEHGDRLSGFIYSNASVGPVIFPVAMFPPELIKVRAEDKPGVPKRAERWRQTLLFYFAHKDRVTEPMIQEWTELNNRQPAMPPPPAKVAESSHDRTPDDLTHITVPTLFLWGDKDYEATLDRDAAKGFALLAAKDKTMLVVPNCGHMIALDCGPESVAAARPFIDRVAK